MKTAVVFDFCISEAKKKAGKQCCAYACNNKPVKKLGGLCYKHFWRKRRATDPVYIRYNAFKKNAIKRRIDFAITLEQFRKFCEDTGYILKPGKRGQNATVDRIRNWEGYNIDNIQLLTNKQNVSKYNNYDRYQEPPPDWYVAGTEPPAHEENNFNEDEDDLPF